MQRQERRDDAVWQRYFETISHDVILLWQVFRMPCLTLLNMGYRAASRRGGFRDIVRLCEQLINEDQRLPETITTAQQRMYKFRLRIETSFPEHRIGDGDGLSGVRYLRTIGWLGDDDVAIDDEQLVALLWRIFEGKAGARQHLPGTLQRCRLVGFDTQEVCPNVACHQHYAEHGRQWLEARMARLREQLIPVENQEPTLLLDVFNVDQYGRLLVDVRGAATGHEPHRLARWAFATECVASGWAYSTPLHIMPGCVAEALDRARENLVGAWGLQTQERPFAGIFTCSYNYKSRYLLLA